MAQARFVFRPRSTRRRRSPISAQPSVTRKPPDCTRSSTSRRLNSCLLIDTAAMAHLPRPQNTRECHLYLAEGCHLYIAATQVCRIRFLMLNHRLFSSLYQWLPSHVPRRVMSSPDPKSARDRAQGTMCGAAHPSRARTILRSGPHCAHDTPRQSGVARSRVSAGTPSPALGPLQRSEMTASWCDPRCRSGHRSFQPARRRTDRRLLRPHRPESTDAPVIAPPIGYTAMSLPSLAMKPSLGSS